VTYKGKGPWNPWKGEWWARTIRALPQFVSVSALQAANVSQELVVTKTLIK